MSLGNVIDGIQCNDFSKQKFECPNCCQGEEPEARLKECSWIYLNDWRWCCKVCVCNFWMEFFKFVSFSKVTREQDGARSVSFFDGWFGWFLYQESFDWQLSTVSLFAFQKAKRHRTEANLGTMCSYGWQGMEHLFLTAWFCWSRGLERRTMGIQERAVRGLWGDLQSLEPWAFPGSRVFLGSILVQRFFFIKNYSNYRIIGIEWNWTNCTSPLRTLSEVSGLQFQTTAPRHIIDARVFALRTTPRKLSGFLVCMRRHRKRRIWRTWRTYQTCGWLFECILKDVIEFGWRSNCMFLKVSTSWWGRLP